MKKKAIRVRYADFWPGFRPERLRLHKVLSEVYDLVEAKDPDYLIDGGLGYRHLNFNCIKILVLGENLVPDFNDFDYATGFDFLTFGDRYVRIPSYMSYDSYRSLYSRKVPSDEELLNRKFCSFVVSNAGGDPIRRKFFDRLSRYKRIDSGGGWMNNVGGRVPDKLEFCRGYKFNIAFENSVSLGYTTEKLMQPLSVCSVPIYYGNPLVTEDFREGCMVLVRDEADIERAVEEIIRLDQDDAAYLAKCKSPSLVHEDSAHYDRMAMEFFSSIFERPLDQARRLNTYGYQAVRRRTSRPFLMTCQYARDAYWFVYDLMHGKIRGR